MRSLLVQTRRFFSSFFLLLAVSTLGFPFAEARDESIPDLYRILNLNSQATSAQITEQYDRLIHQKGLTENQQMELTLAHSFLTNEKTRQDYDAGRPIQVEIPAESRERFAKMVEPFSKPQASLIRKVGSTALHTASSMGTFYFGMAVVTATKCYRTRDPLYCKEYLESLKEPSGHIGFGIFMGASHMTTKGLNKLLGEKVIAQTAAGFAGLAAGSLANSVFSELYHMPEVDQLFHLSKIKNEKEREKKKSDLYQSIWNKSFGNEKWWKEKVPEISSLIGSALASQVTVSAFSMASDKALKKLAPRIGTGIASETAPSRLRCSTSQFLQAIIKGAGISGRVPRALHKGSAEVANLLVFMGYEGLLHPVADRAWNYLVLEPELKKNREKLLRDRPAPVPRKVPYAELEKIQKEALADLESELKENAGLWEESRRRKMKPVEELMGIHAKDLGEFDKEVSKAHAFYGWLMNGAGNPKDSSWESIRDTYYTDRTTRSDIEKDSKKYLRAFFTGAEPSQAFRDSEDIHGLPIPGKMSIEVKPFRATSKVDPNAKNLSDDQLMKKIKSQDYSREEANAYANLEVAAHPIRVNRLLDYEKRQEKEILAILTSTKTPGVLESIQVQIAELEILKKKVKSPEKQAIIQKNIVQTQQQQQAIQTLIEYYRTPEANRETPDLDISSLINSMDPNNQEEWLKAVNYYKSFILQ